MQVDLGFAEIRDFNCYDLIDVIMPKFSQFGTQLLICVDEMTKQLNGSNVVY